MIRFWMALLLLSHTFADQSGHVLFLIHRGQLVEALTAYSENCKALGKHDFGLLQQIALDVLEQGIRSTEGETRLMALFGAGVSANEKALPLLQMGLLCREPQLQLVSLNFLARYQNDHCNAAINRALLTAHPLIRLEACFMLAQMRAPQCVGQAEALMAKFPPELTPIFPRLFAMIGDASSTRTLRKLLTHSDVKVRLEAILSVAQFKRDDLLPTLRTLASQHDVRQQEACAMALGILKDGSSKERLEKLTCSKNSHVQLAAHWALYQIGENAHKAFLLEAAKNQNPFAITLLADIPGSEETLFALCQQENGSLRMNSALSLLHRRDVRALPFLKEIWFPDARDVIFLEETSPGQAMKALKIVTSSTQKHEETPVMIELAIDTREKALIEAVELPQPVFLHIADMIFQRGYSDLHPILTRLLSNLESEEATALLKREQQRAGAPFIRMLATLALYQMDEEGPYGANLQKWLQKELVRDVVHFRPTIPFELRERDSQYELTPQQTTQIYIEALETLAQKQQDSGIDLLLWGLANGHERNRCLIAGLLLRATQ